MNLIGKPRDFDIQLYIKVINQMILADEIDLALNMIDNPPGWYRDNENQPLKELKEKLLKQTFDTKAYIECETPIPKDQIMRDIPQHLKYPRFDVIAEEIKKYNDQGLIPWIYELAPGSAWESVNFERLGLKFNYKAHTLSQRMEEAIRNNYFPYLWADEPKNQPTMFVCCELIEHLKDPKEISHIMTRTGIKFDQIYISTPKYTWAGGLDSWENNALGHLRTYTPNEFIRFFYNTFPGYQATYYEHHCMMIKGLKIG